ncbi:MAG: NADP-dependent phosphogluconate dehydrogenase [Rhodospirillales bacterium]
MTSRAAPGAALGLVGVGTMGAGLARSFTRAGFPLAAFDHDGARLRDLSKRVPAAVAVADLGALVTALKRPRAVLLMVTAGKPVDEVLDALRPLLEPGDVVIDGGNSHYRDTERRAASFAARGVDFIGAGISGGEEGALKGAAIMAGGPRPAFKRVAPMLEAVAARASGEPCLGWFGPGGAGHFVKTVHNGIEYAVMQSIAETWMALHLVAGQSNARCARHFARWNKGAMGSYLIEITAELLALKDQATGGALVDAIRDNAGQKGTGQWAAQAALELGLPAPTLAEAVFARAVSGWPGRGAVPGLPATPRGKKARFAGLAPTMGEALDAAILCAYAQGFTLIEAAARAWSWPATPAEAARVWRAGCILRAKSLEPMRGALAAGPAIPGLLLAPALAPRIARGIGALRIAVSAAAASAVPAPCLASALAWFDALAAKRLWTALVQAQRDRFGQHGFERMDRPGRFHLDGSKA